ncbi:hypothetical protein PENTCL1PPCAC_9370 [Pristionchus entomophagus]|uniref:Integrase zinc-binding domain-containing protein n=1 Tax=Pristionchus entomophagus TaxID=358040 RepID=A0AAV5T4D0_9BILA|nr:hypothetical protein PENTCL1PPCAC_9370 [Pristionchus entomophagus]
MMDESKEMIHNEDEDHGEVVEEDFELEDNELMVNDSMVRYIDEEEVPYEQIEDDPFGGMEHDVYNAIVDFKLTGQYPQNGMADQGRDRSAHCHWRLRCSRFSMHEDQMTLLYGSETAENPKFVVRKGEAKYVIERVHILIGHVGTKRTQAALQKKMYWRSVRNDVMQFVASCDYCRQKKAEGKKLSKAPIDITSDDFGLDVHVDYDRIQHKREIKIRLNGPYNEEYVNLASQSRMTSYTFRSTQDSEHRKMYRTPTFFKRQPYLRRSRQDQGGNSTFLVPILHRDTREPTYMAFHASRLDEAEKMIGEKNKYIDDIDEDEDLTPVDPTVASGSRAPSAASEQVNVAADEAAAGPSTSRPRVAAARQPTFRPAKVYDASHPAYRRSKTERSIKEGRHPRRDEHGALRGAAARLSGMMIQNALRGDAPSSSSAAAAAERHLMFGQSHGLVGHDTYDFIRDRPEQALLAPILLMASNDPEVAELQKELLNRQLEIQKMQMRVLQHMQLEPERYEEVVDGRDDEDVIDVIDTDGY